MTDGRIPQPGKPIPPGAVRIGTFSVEQSRPKWFELKVSFTVPDVTGDFYSVGMCNDPCTLGGFKEPLIGLISIVQTTREGALLTQRQRLISADLLVAPRGEEAGEGDGRAAGPVHVARAGAFHDGERDGELQERLAATSASTSTPENRSRPLLAPSTGIVLVLALFALSALILARKPRSPRGPSHLRSEPHPEIVPARVKERHRS